MLIFNMVKNLKLFDTSLSQIFFSSHLTLYNVKKEKSVIVSGTHLWLSVEVPPTFCLWGVANQSKLALGKVNDSLTPYFSHTLGAYILPV